MTIRKSDGFGSDPPRVVADFAMMPARCFGDLRFGPRHFSVLGLICKHVDKAGVAVITQGSIGRKGNRSRKTVAQSIDDLVAWGYVIEINRGRQTTGMSRGRFKTFAYQVVYSLPEGLRKTFEGASKGLAKRKRRVNHVGYTARVNHVRDNSVQPTWVADSYIPKSDPSASSDIYVGSAARFATPQGGFARGVAADTPPNEGEEIIGKDREQVVIAATGGDNAECIQGAQVETAAPTIVSVLTARPKTRIELMASCKMALEAPRLQNGPRLAVTLLDSLRAADAREAVYDAAQAAETAPDTFSEVDALKQRLRKKIGPNRLARTLMGWEAELPTDMPQGERVAIICKRLGLLAQELAA